MLPVSKPAPRDPAPSRLRYRLQRWWLTPHVRWTVRRGLPFVILLLAGAYVVTMPSVQEAAKRTLSDVRSHVAARPELQVTQMRMAGVPDQLRGPVDAAVGVSLPISTLDLKPLEIKARIEALDAVKAAQVRVDADGVLAIDVAVRVPRVVMRDGAALVLLDLDGHPVDRIAARADRADLPLIAGQSAGQHVREAMELLYIARPIAGRIRGLVRVGERRWDIVLDRDQAIRLPANGAAEALSRVIALNAADDILERDVTVWDMRDPRRPTLRLGPHAREELLRLRSPIVVEKT
ncbi:MAG: cell division protein FtsQ/DivIB [Pseudomonadota bacterium]